jgi:hypothetical protein
MSAHPVAVDWFRVLWDLARIGISMPEIERRTGISSSALYGYREGSHPQHWRGEMLIDMWCDVMDKPRASLPMVSIVLAPRVVHARPQVRRDDVAMQRLSATWAGGAL